MSFASKVLTLGAFAAGAIAHGTVRGLTIDGQYHGGFLLDYYYMKQNGQTPPETAGWYAENLDNGFVEPNAYSTADIICHKNAEPATGSVSVAAGSTIDFHWTDWPESHAGPVILYAAKVDDFSSINKESLKFVKIEEAGYESGEWAAVKLIGTNNTWTSTVPSSLAAGKYVFRHEIIALHGAGSVNGAQNYPQCFNVEVTGSGTASPEGTLGTALYTPEEEGIVFNMYGQFDSYPIPGPALMAGGGSGSGSGSGSGNSTTPTPTAAPAPSTPATTVVATATATVIAETPSASAPASPAPTSGSGSGSDLPETFTLDTFISWLREKAGSSSSKARRHARDF